MPISAVAASRLALGVVGLGLVGLLAALGWLGRLERAGPAHADIELDGGIPATFYVQGQATPFGLPVDPPAAAERPPAVVLCHGFGEDRAMMSTLARRIAANGYAVLAIDARGHGENRNRFDGGGDGSAAAIAGRALLVAALYLGTATGLLPWVIDLMLPVVAVVFVLGEILAWPIYALSRNRLVIALVQAGWFGWLVAATMPMRL